MPRFERQENRDNEISAATRLEQAHGIKIAQTPSLAIADWVVHKDAILKCFVEYRWRKDFYPTVTVNEKKITGLAGLAELFNVPVFFVLEHNHRLYSVDVREHEKWLRTIQTRKKVRCNADIDARVVHIPKAAFKEIKT